MKARNKKTGEIAELASYAKITLESCDSYGCQKEWNPEDVELIQNKTDDFDWQSFRAEAAKSILTGIVAHSNICISSRDADRLTKLALTYVDELIKQLKEKE